MPITVKKKLLYTTIYDSRKANAKSTIVIMDLNNFFKLIKSVSVKNQGCTFHLKDFSQSQFGTFALSVRSHVANKTPYVIRGRHQ